MEFTNVYYENSREDAEQRLALLRKDNKTELKVYIIEMPDGKWRLLRRIVVNSTVNDSVVDSAERAQRIVSAYSRKKKGVV